MFPGDTVVTAVRDSDIEDALPAILVQNGRELDVHQAACAFVDVEAFIGDALAQEVDAVVEVSLLEFLFNLPITRKC